MATNYIYSININVWFCIDHGIGVNHAMLLHFFTLLPNWSRDREEIDGDIYYRANYSKIIEQLPLLSDKKDTVYRHIKTLIDKWLLKKQYLKDYFFVTDLGSTYLFSSEKNPVEAGKKSGGGSEKNPTYKDTINKDTNKINNTNINISKQSLPGEQTTPASIQDNGIGIKVPKVYWDNSINDFLENFTQQCKKLDIPYKPRWVQERRYARFIMSQKRERETAGIGGTLEHKIYKLLHIYNLGKKDIKMPIITSVVDIYYKWAKIMHFAYLRKDNKPLYQDFVAINKSQNTPKTFNINQMP